MKFYCQGHMLEWRSCTLWRHTEVDGDRHAVVVAEYRQQRVVAGAHAQPQLAAARHVHAHVLVTCHFVGIGKYLVTLKNKHGRYPNGSGRFSKR